MRSLRLGRSESGQEPVIVKLPAFYPIIDTHLLHKAGITPEEMAVALAKAGVEIAQFRHKGAFTREVFAQAQRVGGILKGAGVAYVINDRADVARMLDADGVHVGQDDLFPDKVRSIVGSSAIIGFSTHNEGQLSAGDQEPVNYLAIGPIFGTSSKENPNPTLGLRELASLRPLTSKPLVAIGGISRTNARQVLDAGADSVAVISDLIAPPDELPGRIVDWLEAVR